MVIQHNLLFINAQNQYKVSTGARAKTTEKLSSGYRINRAADDAAGLTISEKLRSQIRGLNRGADNGQDGISWIQTGDGALNEVHSILHRMKELTVQALNDTNTEEDRAALQAEMDSLQSEIDRITDTTQFNEQNIFAEHEPVYYQYEGNVQWNQSQVHVINASDNQMVINYSKDGSTTEQLVIEVPVGQYTTQELTDEMDDALNAMGVEGINVEYTDDGTFNVNFEGGEKIEEVTGGLAKLLYDSYAGGSVGALIGTTSFPSDTLKMTISNDNNNLAFDIEYFDGTSRSVNVTLTPGKYTRQELIDKLNDALAGTHVTAQSYGTGIKLGSNEAIITGFKGNMFKIDGGANPYTSIFYDNVKYGSISTTSAQFVGGTIIPNNVNDVEHQKITITSSNNELIFKSNGSDTPVTITIPQGDYTIEDMRDELNQLFLANNLELDAIVNNDGSYKGITITSKVKGAVSDIGLSSSSSAYNTLFVKRVYNSYKTDAVETVENTANRQATFTGSKTFDGNNSLVITEDNNEFLIEIDGTDYTIKIDNGTYNTADDLCAEINDKLNGAQALGGYKGKINAVSVNNKISLVTTSASGIVNFEAGASGSDMGYDNIFVGKKQTITQTSTSASAVSGQKPTITLNTPISDPTNITEADKNLTVNVNGSNMTVTLPTGNVTHADIIDAINNQLKEKIVTTDNTFTTLDVVGRTTSNSFYLTGTAGQTKVSNKNYSNTGSSTILEGTAITGNNVAAKVKMDVALPENMVIDNNNHSLQITINGVTKAITLDNNTYSRSGLATEIQKKIDAAFGGGVGGATVTIEDNKLVFTARMDAYTNGRDTDISFSTSTSSFIRDLHTTETKGYVTSNNLSDRIAITENTKEFSFKYVEDGVSKTANITLDKGTYTRSSFVSMLNTKLGEEGINITASLYGDALKLETNSAGNGNSITLDSDKWGNSVEAVFGPMETKHIAAGTVDRVIQNSITIDGTTDVFNIRVNNTDYSLTLDHGTYDRTTFVDMLNAKLSGTGVGVRLSNNCLRFETEGAGRDKNIYFKYSNGGNSMVAIFGQTTSVVPGVTASFDANNKLVLTGTQNGTSLSVNSGGGSAFMEPNIKTENIAVSKQTGYYSTKYAQVDGVNITDPVKIDQWNDELSFVYKENGNFHSVSITLPANDYTFADLENALQSEIDNQLGSGELEVEVSASGVVIKATNAGNDYSIPKGNFSGDFYYKVMCSTKETTSNRTPAVKNGSAPKDTAYTVGRKDVKNNSVEIKAGINDTLSLDFTYGNTTTTFTIKLDAGTYSGESLKEMIQEKLDNEVVNAGLSKGIIEVGIGGISTGVVGSNDNNALNFKLSQSVRLPEDGTYIIDGVKGNAAFSIFYQTDGELVPAYVKGAKDIEEGVVIEAGKDTISMNVEGNNYSITLTAGEYTAEGIITEINDKLVAAGAPVTAELDEGVLKFSHHKLGERQITNIAGNGKNALFFNENGEKGEKKDIKIQLSSREGDYITIDRPVLNTVKLGINSIVITDPKYANKALTRIDKAVNQVSQIRSDFGAIQNRLEFSINSNKNNSENTQAAESLLRDADMAEAMTKYAKEQILMQAGEAMMAQANSLAEGVLRILGV